MSQKPRNKCKCCLVFSMDLQIQAFSKIIVQDFTREKRPSRSDSLPEETIKPRGFPKEANEDEPCITGNAAYMLYYFAKYFSESCTKFVHL